MVQTKQDYVYTPFFCEENIWLLGKRLIQDEGFSARQMCVLFFLNPCRSVILCNQNQARTNRFIAWDYHVVLQIREARDAWIYDFDSRLPFPCAAGRYFESTFPDQRRLPRAYRTWIRMIPVHDYLRRFTSDRSHMKRLIDSEKYPIYPPILAKPDCQPTTLLEYLDMKKRLEDDSNLIELEKYRPSPDPGA